MHLLLRRLPNAYLGSDSAVEYFQFQDMVHSRPPAGSMSCHHHADECMSIPIFSRIKIQHGTYTSLFYLGSTALICLCRSHLLRLGRAPFNSMIARSDVIPSGDRSPHRSARLPLVSSMPLNSADKSYLGTMLAARRMYYALVICRWALSDAHPHLCCIRVHVHWRARGCIQNRDCAIPLCYPIIVNASDI